MPNTVRRHPLAARGIGRYVSHALGGADIDELLGEPVHGGLGQLGLTRKLRQTEPVLGATEYVEEHERGPRERPPLRSLQRTLCRPRHEDPGLRPRTQSSALIRYGR